MNEVFTFTVHQQSLTELKFSVFDGMKNIHLCAEVILCTVAAFCCLASQILFEHNAMCMRLLEPAHYLDALNTCIRPFAA